MLCGTCCETIKIYSIGQCNHNNICHICSLKLRLFYNEKKCPLCRVFIIFN